MKIQTISKDSLSPEQKEFLDKTSYMNHVVEGGPGTGKTCLAIMRARRLYPQSRVLLLVYNRPLMMYLQSALQANTSWGFQVDTYHNWLSTFYSEVFGCRYPQTERFNPVWEEIEPQLCSLGKKYFQIIVDEGQDFPLPLIRCLRSLSEHMTVFIDSKQAMEQDKTSSLEIAEILGTAVYKLSTNYRSTEEITAFSNLFRQGEKVNPNKENKGRAPIIHYCNDYAEQLTRIEQIIINNPQKEIGIIANRDSVRHLYEELTEALGNQFHIQYYLSQQDNNIDFDVSGVRVVTYGTMKGLEFDIVVLPRFTRVMSTGDEVADYNRLHVATSRAKEKLYLICFKENTANKNKWIDTLAPLKDKNGLFAIE